MSRDPTGSGGSFSGGLGSASAWSSGAAASLAGLVLASSMFGEDALGVRPTDGFWFSVVGLSFVGAVTGVATSVASIATTRARADRRAVAGGLLGLALVVGWLVAVAVFVVQLVRAFLSLAPVR